ncbi:MAG: SagB/ThcOx family dehydrogenase [Deltaproteobacteria bacterium]|nr:SagB/ThcOx family dehydrogenase [Deltaproteobacteria bacterium]
MKLLWGAVMLIAGFFFSSSGAQALEVVKLPSPAYKGAMSVEEALKQRRTVRRFAGKGLDLKQVGQILWGADGVSDPRGYRTAASAGATFPMEIYLVVGERGVSKLAAGVYRYRPEDHALELTSKGDARQAVARASLHQTWMAEAPVMVVIAAEFRRCTARYGQRGIMYTHMEAGHVGTNVFLQAEALGLGAGIVGAFEDKGLAQALKLPGNHEPLLVMPVGYKY